jgi:hypothetical protein
MFRDYMVSREVILCFSNNDKLVQRFSNCGPQLSAGGFGGGKSIAKLVSETE